MDSEYLLLIDGSSLLSTQYYGNLPKEVLFAKTEEDRKKFYHKIMHTKTGIYTNAVYGFMRTLLKILKEQRPGYIAVAWDKSRNTFRREIYSEYKGNRGETPAPLKEQFELCEELLSFMNIRQFMDDRFEADDFCGSLSKKFENELPVRILTKDNDYLQLVTEKTNLWLMHASASKTDELYKKYGIKQDGSVPERAFCLTPELVKKEFGVEPGSINSLKGLQGDSSDNIKGVPGVGPATAVALIAKYKNVKTLYDEIRDLNEKEQKAKAAEWKAELGITRSPFGPLLKTSEEELVGEAAAMISEKLATIKCDIPLDDIGLNDLKLNIDYTRTRQEFLKLEFNTLKIEDPSENSKVIQKENECIDSLDSFTKLFASLKNSFESNNKSFKSVGMSLCYDDSGKKYLLGPEKILAAALSTTEKNYYVSAEGFITGGLIAESINKLIDAGISFAVTDIKTVMKLLQRNDYVNCFDISIAAYLLNPLAGKYDYDDAALISGIDVPSSRQEIIGKEKTADLITNDPERIKRLTVTEAETALDCCSQLTKALKEAEMYDLYQEIELPLTIVLKEMEENGILVLKDELKKFSEILDKDIKVLEKEIYDGCGEVFNINSPKQLGTILFEKLKLPYGKKTKTGYSTSADILEKLKLEDPVVEKILNYRQLTKLKSTYADGLNDYIDEDGRIRTNFNQTVTATGRLSSTEPNLQNIPIRESLGRELRKVFVPAEGKCFVDADYSQIELRILASLSGDEKLINAYKNSADIHQSTASAVFKVPMEEVTKELRSKAKAVNFGIVYGISSFGLGTGLNIPKKEAERYIQSYFETYPQVKEYLDRMISEASKNGYSVTVCNRRRPIPELSSSNFMQRSFGERIAMNSPVQGSAADIIKLAMIKVYERLKKECPEAKILLQIHDELLVEVDKDKADKAGKILVEEMQNAINLPVKLEVGLAKGESWYEAH
ncbi:MAG: DNA polymerase I [Lachnospiraceae bacterium]|nr:DNA polymerase I [Lachnospiraceae bacterium]